MFTTKDLESLKTLYSEYRHVASNCDILCEPQVEEILKNSKEAIENLEKLIAKEFMEKFGKLVTKEELINIGLHQAKTGQFSKNPPDLDADALLVKEME